MHHVYAVKPKLRERGPTRKYLTTLFSRAKICFPTLQPCDDSLDSGERLWVYLCHVECFTYVSRRFLGERPDSDEEAETRVLNHFFVKNNREKLRDNGVSRLWWLGYIAHQIDEQNPHSFLETLMHKQDLRSSILDRLFISMNLRTLKSIYLVMRGH